MKYFSTRLYLKSMLEVGLLGTEAVTYGLKTWATQFNGKPDVEMTSIGYMISNNFLTYQSEKIDEAFDYLDYLLKKKKIRSALHLVLTEAIKAGVVERDPE